MSNKTVISDMLSAFWTYVTTHADIVSLNLKKFPQFLGQPLPARQGVLSATEIPAIFTEAFIPRFTAAEMDNAAKQRVVEVEIPVCLIYGNTVMHQAHNADVPSQSFMTLVDVLGAEVARFSGGIVGAAIDDFEFDPIGVEPVIAEESGRMVIYWIGEVRVKLRKLVTFA